MQEYKVDIELGGDISSISVKAENESKVIEHIWREFGYMTPIHRIYLNGVDLTAPEDTATETTTESKDEEVDTDGENSDGGDNAK